MADKPQWLIREDASTPVLVALALRQLLGVRAPADLPALRGLEVRAQGKGWLQSIYDRVVLGQWL